MKYCAYCGSRVDDSMQFCPNCGARQEASFDTDSGARREGGDYANNKRSGGDFDFAREHFGGGVSNDPSAAKGSFWIALLSFFVPLVGLILWYTWRITKPGKATSAAKGALASICIGGPFIGLILWLIWKDGPHRELAKAAGIAAIIGVVLSVLLPFIIILLASVLDPEFYSTLEYLFMV